MKNLLWLIILISIIFSSCAAGVFIPVYDIEIPELENDVNYEIIEIWIEENIEYKRDESKTEDDWQTPIETIDIGTGDCEDKAILFLFLANQYLGIKGYLQGVYFFKSDIYHMTAVVDDYWYGMNTNFSYEYTVSYDYGRALVLAEYYL